MMRGRAEKRGAGRTLMMEQFMYKFPMLKEREPKYNNFANEETSQEISGQLNILVHR